MALMQGAPKTLVDGPTRRANWQQMVPDVRAKLGQRVAQTAPSAPPAGPLPNQPWGPQPKSGMPQPVTPNPSPYPPVMQPGPDDIWGYVDPVGAANKRAQLRVDSGVAAYNNQIDQTLQAYSQARDRLKDDTEWATRMGAQANMRQLQQTNAVHSGMRDRLADRLEYTQSRAMTRAMEDLAAKEILDRQGIETNIANLQASLPVLQAEEYDRELVTTQQEIQNALQQASATGIFLPGKVPALAAGVMKEKQNWLDAQARGDEAGMAAAHTRANQLRMAIQRYGVDPSSVEANITLPDATMNLNTLGTMTPEQRERLIAMFGYDPLSGKMTLGGTRATQQNDMGALELDIARNPEYGAAAQSRAELDKILAGIAETQANTTRLLADANRTKAETPKDEDKPLTREQVMQRWPGLTEFGLTTNFAAFDTAMGLLATEISNDWSRAEAENWLSLQARALASSGVDVGALARAIDHLFNLKAIPLGGKLPKDAYQDYRSGERGG